MRRFSMMAVMLMSLVASGMALAAPKGVPIKGLPRIGSGNNGSNGNGNGNVIKKPIQIQGGVPVGNGGHVIKPIQIHGGITVPNGVAAAQVKKLTLNQNFTNYHLTHGVKFHQGICYKGKLHHHWSHCCFIPHCGCNCCWCPCLCSWYYWCEPDQCWYPITFCPYGRFTF